MVEEEKELTAREKEIARLRAAEVFMQKETGDAVCGTCGYTYQMAKGENKSPHPQPPRHTSARGAQIRWPKARYRLHASLETARNDVRHVRLPRPDGQRCDGCLDFSHR
jgi:ribosomal protein S27AE